MEMMIWNFILTVIVAILGFLVKGRMDELDRISILLNRTREEVARDHITRAEVNTMVEGLGTRIDKAFERLENKIDKLAGKA
jgi:hypothetical protein